MADEKGRSETLTSDDPIYAIGHSTHPIDAFIGILKTHGIRTLADVRTVPRSRHVPQFNRDALEASLRNEGIGYRHLPNLGGLRKPRRDSTNLGWRNAGFRGFADHMQTAAFDEGIAELIDLSKRNGPVVIVCAEALPWRCHRSLIADALTARGIPVLQIDSKGNAEPYSLTPFARVMGGRVTYPASAARD